MIHTPTKPVRASLMVPAKVSGNLDDQGEERSTDSGPEIVLNKVSAIIAKSNPYIVRDDVERRRDQVGGDIDAGHVVMRDDVGRSMLCGGVCRKTETGRGRACVDGQIAADNVLGGVCQGELCVGGCGEGCLVLASGGGGETVAGTQIESQSEMEEDWTHTEPGIQMKLGGLTVHSVQGGRKSHVPRTASRHSLKGKINFWETLGQGESGQAARNSGPAPKILADRQERAKRNHVA